MPCGGCGKGRDAGATAAAIMERPAPVVNPQAQRAQRRLNVCLKCLAFLGFWRCRYFDPPEKLRRGLLCADCQCRHPDEDKWPV